VKIKGINIKNFMTINEAHLDFTKGVKTREKSTNNGTNVVPFTVIVGPNGSGKTNVIRAVQIFSKLFFTGGPPPDLTPYYLGQRKDRPFRIEISVEFSEEEKRALADSLVFSLISQMALGGAFDKLRRYYNEGLHRWLEGPFLSLFDDLTLYVEATGFFEYPLNMGIKANDTTKKGEERVLYLGHHGDVANFDLGVRPFINPDHSISWKELIGFLPPYGELLLGYIDGKWQEPPGISAEVPAISIFDIFEGFCQGKKCEMKMSDLDVATSNIATVGRVDAILQGAPYNEPWRRLTFFLSQRGKNFASSSSQNLFYAVLEAIFASSLLLVPAVKGYPHPAELGISLGSASGVRELTDSTLVQYLFALRNSYSGHWLYDQVRRTFRQINEEDLDFDLFIEQKGDGQGPSQVFLQLLILQSQVSGIANSLPPSESVPQSVNQEPKNDKEKAEPNSGDLTEIGLPQSQSELIMPLENSSAGAIEELYLAAAIAGSRDGVLMLDEPAQNLHPMLQGKVLEKLHAAAKAGDNGGDNQIILITHSPYMVPMKERSEATQEGEKIYRFSRDNAGTYVIDVVKVISDIEQDPQNPKGKTFLTRVWVDPAFRSALFAKGTILVEGIGDYLFVRKLDELKGYSLLGDGNLVLMEMKGVGNLSHYRRFCEGVKLDWVAIVDHDFIEKDKKQRVCKEFGLDSNLSDDQCITELRKIGVFVLAGQLEDLIGVKDHDLKKEQKLEQDIEAINSLNKSAVKNNEKLRELSEFLDKAKKSINGGKDRKSRTSKQHRGVGRARRLGNPRTASSKNSRPLF